MNLRVTSVMGQLLGLIALIVGLFLLLGLAWGLVASGVVVVLFSTALEIGQAPAKRKAT